MPKYNVLVTRDCTESTTVDVEADDPEEAKEKALNEALYRGHLFDWTPDDGSGGGDTPYLADEDECCTLAEDRPDGG